MAQGYGSTTSGQPSSGVIRTSQILVGALMMGLLMFSGVVVYLRLSGSLSTTGRGIAGGPGSGLPDATAILLIGVMTGLTVVTAIVGFLLRSVVVRVVRKKVESGETVEQPVLLLRYQTLTIARAALAEAPALLATVIVMLTGNWLAFIGTGVGLLMLLVVMPSRGKFDVFVRAATGPGGYG